MNFTILLPTTVRNAVLEPCLQSLASIDPTTHHVELLILPNGPSGKLEPLLASHEFPFSVQTIQCLEVGKNHALNAGFAASRGDWLVCLDDDIVVQPDYLSELANGLERWPLADCFGGPVVLRWPPESSLDPRVIQHVQGFAYASLAADAAPEGEVDAFPFLGSNLVLRRSALEGAEPFEAGSGPAPGTYRMGGMVSILRSLRNRNRTCVFLPHLAVEHLVRSEQLTLDWVLRRSRSWGRSLAHFCNQYRDINGAASTNEIRRKLLQRWLRRLVFSLKRESYPLQWATIDIEILLGILDERKDTTPIRSRNE